MDSKTTVILGARIGGIAAARRSSKEGRVWGCDSSQLLRQTCGYPAAPISRW